METITFTIVSEPVGRVYRGLLDAALDCCDLGLLVERPAIDSSEQCRLVVSALRRWIREEENLDEWPGTKLSGHTALVRRFCFNPGSAEVLKQFANSLYEWQQPTLLEDLCLLRQSGEPWLVTIAHERDGYLRISEKERDDLVERVPELAEMLRYTP